VIDADALVCVAANIWLRSLEPSPARWLVKRGVMEAIDAVCTRRGYFPARVLRMGSDDESREYFRDFVRYVRTGRWASRDGAHDYLANLARVTAPVMQIASDGDRLNCHPACAEAFLARCGGIRALERVRRADD